MHLADLTRQTVDRHLAAPKHRISRLAFMLAGLLIAVCSASLLFVGYVASNASDQQAVENEQHLFQNVLQHRLQSLVQEQLYFARSDDAVRKLVRAFKVPFVQDQLSALWSDHNHSRTVLIDSNRTIRVEAFGDYTHITNAPLAGNPLLETVYDQAQAHYQKNRVRVPGGFSHRSLQGLEPEDYAVLGFAEVDQRVAMIGAVPIMPDYDRITLPDGPATVLVSAVFIDGGMLTDLHGQLAKSDAMMLQDLSGALSFDQLKFSRTLSDQKGAASLTIHGLEGQTLGAFEWQSRTVGMSIWPTVIPVVLVLSVALAILAFGITWRIGELTKSLQESEQRNRYLALHDTLSGLANRLQFNQALAKATQNLPDTPFALLHCDLDKFKHVNDTFGHAAGDTVIKTVAERLQKRIGADGLVSRIGGDEFVILFHRYVERDRLKALSIQMIADVKQQIPLENEAFAQIGLSVGIALAPDDGSDKEMLVTAADKALYDSKGAGRGRSAFVSEEPQRAITRLGTSRQAAHRDRSDAA